jgi:hypothetical protein
MATPVAHFSLTAMENSAWKVDFARASQEVSMLQTNRSFNRHRRQFMLLMVAALAGGVSIIGNQIKANSGKRFKSFTELSILAARANGDPIAGGGPRQSLPVPVRRQGHLEIAFMFCFYMFRPDGARIWPPSTVAWIDPVSGKLIASTTVSPADFGQTHPADKPLDGNVNFPSGMTTESFLDLEKRLYALYDVLLEARAAKPSTSGHGTVPKEARDFIQAFDQIIDLPLRPYYDALGHDYFEWARALAR